jgi:hypothetical protein
MTVAQLRDHPDYELWLELKHHEIMPFVQAEFSRQSPLLRAYLYFNLFLLLGMAALMGWQVYHGQVALGKALQCWALGMVAVLTILIPVHEGIHGLAYKLVGAPRVRYGADLSKFIFYAMADHFVVASRHFYIVAMAPFVVLGIFALLPIFYVSLNYQWFCWGVLLMHTGACAGDFAMLSFYLRHRDEDLRSYDDVQQGVSFFFRRKRPQQEEALQP